MAPKYKYKSLESPMEYKSFVATCSTERIEILSSVELNVT